MAGKINCLLIERGPSFFLEPGVGFVDGSSVQFPMRLFRYFFLLFCIVTMGALVWGAIYARKEGFTKSWRDAIEREFAARGYHVEIGKLTLGAFRGLVAEDVKFFQDASRTQEVAVLDDVFLDVDLSKVFDKKQISVNTLDVQDASLSLPLEEGDEGRRFRVENLSGRIVITESVIEIVKAEASMVGFDLEIKGSLIRPQKDQSTDDEERKPAGKSNIDERRRQITAVLAELENIRFLDDDSKIVVEFRGNLDDMSTISAEASVETGQFKRKGNRYTVDSLSFRLEFDGPTNSAEIEELILSDKHGELSMNGSWSKDLGRVDFSVDSSADLPSLLGLFSQDKRIGEIVFFNPPEVKASGHVALDEFGDEDPGFPGEIIGELHVERFGTRGTVFAGLDAGFSVAGERFYIRNLRLDHKTGVAFLNLKYEPEEEVAVLYQTEIKLDPMVFRPFFNESGRNFLDAWNFGDNSTVYLAGIGEGGSWDVSTWKNKGVIDLRQFRLNGVPFLEMEAEVETEEDVLWFRDVSLKREEGAIVAELAKNDFPSKQWEVKGVVSTVNLVEGARAFSPKLSESLAKYRTSQPPTIRLSGSLDARPEDEVGDEPRKNLVDISFETEGVTEYDFFKKTLELDAPTGEVRVDGSRVHLKSMEAGAFGGKLSLDFDSLDVRSESKPFTAAVRIEGVPLEKVTKLYNDSDSITGSVETEFEISGDVKEVTSIHGTGRASIDGGRLFALPLLGPLSNLVARSSERDEIGRGVAREAKATFRIENGILHTDDIEAYTNALRVRSAGTVSFVDKGVDLEAVVNTKDPLSSAILIPVSELLTYECSGTITEPVWKPKHISNLGKLPVGVISEMTNVPIEGLKILGRGLFGDQREEGESGERRGLFQKRNN